VRSRSQAGTRRALPVLAIAMTATLTNMLQAAAIFVLLLLAIALLNFLVLGGGRAVPFGSLVQGSRIEFVAGDEGRARPRGDAPACLDEAQMRRRIDAAAQVIVTSQPKVAGKSMRAFAHECSPVTAAHKSPATFDNLRQEDRWKLYLLAYREMPGVVADHISGRPLASLLHSIPRDVLLVAMYREEGSRLRSGVNQVLQAACDCHKGQEAPFRWKSMKGWVPKFKGWASPPKNMGEHCRCRIHERDLLNLVQSEEKEIGAYNALSCPTWEAIAADAPNLIFADYRRTGALQGLLAARHCPHLRGQEKHANAASNHTDEIAVAPEDGDADVPLADWLIAKGPMLEWALHHDADATCKAEARRMGARLAACPDGYLDYDTL